MVVERTRGRSTLQPLRCRLAFRAQATTTEKRLDTRVTEFSGPTAFVLRSKQEHGHWNM